MAVSGRPFHELTEGEAKIIAKDIVRLSRSEEEIRRRLTEAGFCGASAAVCTQSFGGMFQAMVMVWGPHGEVINA